MFKKAMSRSMPDILDCLADLSNDEVFTPPELANQVLDMLPKELFLSRSTRFLDPCTKSGVFLREITKRLIEGQIPGYEKTANEITQRTARAIQNAIEQKVLNPSDPEFTEKAQRIGDNAKTGADRIFEKKIMSVLDHILKNQVFGIAITELTAEVSRRSLYCSKDAAGKYSICRMDSNDGNIRFRRCSHTWVTPNGAEVTDIEQASKMEKRSWRCKYCGAGYEYLGKGREGKESHAYEFIHTERPEDIYNMEFDVIIMNPPFQLRDGGAGASASPIYNKFIEKAKKLRPHYLAAIIPSRWMTGGKGLDQFRKEMIHDRHIRILHDFANSKDCFDGVDIKGGVCYFLRDRDSEGPCQCYRHDVNSGDSPKPMTRELCEPGDDIFIRQNELISIKDKVWRDRSQKSFRNIVSPRKPYGFCGDVFKDPSKYGLPPFSDEKIEGGYAVFGLENMKRKWKYVPRDYPIPKTFGLDKYKIFISKAYGCGEIGEVPATPVLATPVLATPDQACTETFLQIGPWDTKAEAENALSYLQTKFFRVLVSIRKQTQNTVSDTYRYVPMQDFSKPWNDEELYRKYDLSDEEIGFIEKSVQEMNIKDS